MPRAEPLEGAVGDAPHADLAMRSAGRQVVSAGAERQGAAELERLRQDALAELRAGQVDVLRLDVLQIRMAHAELAQIESVELAAQEPEQIGEVTGRISLVLRSATTQQVEQLHQPLLHCPATAQPGDQPVEGRHQDQPLLVGPDVLLRHRLHQRSQARAA